MRLRDIAETCLLFGDRFYTVSQVADAVNGQRGQVRHRLWKLEQGGFITRVRWHKTPPTYRKGRPQKDIQYRNTKALESKAQSTTQQAASGWDKLWKAARIMRRFSLAGLSSITGEKRENVRAWARAYRLAGWIKPARKGGPEVVWVFVKNPPAMRPYYGGKGKMDHDELETVS